MRSLPLTIALCVTIAVPAVAQVPSRMPIQGTLYDLDGEPVDGVLPVDFTLYADPDGTEGLWSDTMDVTFVGGVFTAYLGAGDPIDPIMFAQHPQVFVGVAVDGDSEMDLFALATAPYAAVSAYSGDADTLDGYFVTDIVDEAVGATEGLYADPLHGHDWDELGGVPAGFADDVDDNTQLTELEVDAMVGDNGFLTGVAWGDLTGVPAGFADEVDDDTQLTELEVDAMVGDNGYLTAVAWDDLSGVPAGFADGVDDDTQLTEDSMVDNNGYIEQVTAGFGLTGGGASGSVSLAANTALMQRRVGSSCPDGSSIREIAADGSVTCETDDDSGGDIESVTAGTGLSGGSDSGDVTVSLDAGYTDGRYVNATGDTVSGALSVTGDISFADCSICLRYADNNGGSARRQVCVRMTPDSASPVLNMNGDVDDNDDFYLVFVCDGRGNWSGTW